MPEGAVTGETGIVVTAQWLHDFAYAVHQAGNAQLLDLLKRARPVVQAQRLYADNRAALYPDSEVHRAKAQRLFKIEEDIDSALHRCPRCRDCGYTLSQGVKTTCTCVIPVQKT